ncbi:MAG: ribonuclease E/G [Sphingopyxis sp.]|nr:ribonuclease E/G [Sphingopyxis sp.]
MTTRMLIDARHREETRVAVTKGNRIEEFDFESAEHKQLKGNIYLAKVTRVEPSLQAAFVEYGGNRHGFLAFSEIHPDYYQIPKEDREALLREEAEHAAAAAQRAEEDLDELEGDVADVEYHDEDEHGDSHADRDDDHDHDHEDGDAENGDAEDGAEGSEEAKGGRGDRRGRGRGRGNNNRKGGRGRSRRNDDEDGENRMSLRRRYKIQDVIRRRQVMLVQVVKEERGNKGAALTTYLSLAGRYCVLMPNTMHGGGISRKISNGADRRKLKAMIDELALPPTMGCIVRTAGMSRTKVEIKRDFDYLARLWDEIRENTLGSSAPALIHSDSDLVKRAIRDIYHKDIEEVLVEGDEGYKAAKQFMKLLMPSHARRVKQYADPVSLYQRYGVEDQLAGMLNPVVQLKSGGYLVINPTEALVSIDINSGRSTREHNIEQTAVSTNLEAAHEIARQLRLRDMAGLVVIDFIDMDHGSNVRKVERAMKDALKNDRARIQVGRISGFGLMEMSRQRLRTGVLEASTRPCPHCEGTGLVRTASSAGLSALRLIEEEAARGKGNKITLRASQEATFYLLNEKRRELREIEELYGVTVEILPDGETEGARMAVEVSGPPPIARRSFAPIAPIEDEDDDDFPEEEEEETEEDAGDERPARAREREEGDSEGDGDGRKRRRRRRRGRRGRRDEEGGENGEGREDREGDAPEAEAEAGDEGDVAEAPAEVAAEQDAEQEEAKPRRRRGGRGRKKADAADAATEAEAGPAEAAPAEVIETAEPVAPEPAADEAPAAEEKPKRKRAPRKTKAAAAAEAEAAAATEAVEAAPVADAAPEPEAEPPKPAPKKRASRAKKAVAAEAAPEATREAEPVAADGEEESSPDGEPRRGWWQRTFGN